MRPLATLGLVLLLATACSSPASREEPHVVRLHENVGKEVTIEGAVSRLMQAHVIDTIDRKHAEFVDVPDGDQVVCYTKEKLPDGAKLRLTGTVLRAGGGPPGSKAEDFFEYQLDVSRWEKLTAK
jgi:hypothetical protein